MRTLLWTFLIIECLNVLFKSCRLSLDNYPRHPEIDAWEDLLALLISCGFVVWICELLFH